MFTEVLVYILGMSNRFVAVICSFVRSITMDDWSQAQLAMMENGGNANAKEFFLSHGETDFANIKGLFNTDTGMCIITFHFVMHSCII